MATILKHNCAMSLVVLIKTIYCAIKGYFVILIKELSSAMSSLASANGRRHTSVSKRIRKGILLLF